MTKTRLKTFSIGRRLYLAVALLCCSGCFSTTHLDPALLDHLSSSGPVILNPQNPYLAADMLIAKEIERSAEVKGFIAHQGSPRAIELHRNMFAPITLDLYYPDTHRYYSLEEYREGWIISGPFGLSPEQEQALISLNPISASPTEAVAKGDASATHFVSPLTDSAAQAAIPVPEKISLSALRKIVDGNSTEIAERTPRGDLIHHVTLPGETVSIISCWYTLETSNNGRIARINRLTTPETITSGDTITIPNYLVKNPYRLMAQALAELQAEMAQR